MTWRRAARRLGGTLAVTLLAVGASAHVGSPDTIWEGNAGAYPVRVIIRDPGVIPGLAEIVVRSKGPGVERVAVTATVWNAEGGAPPPEVATRVPGDSALWSTQLWFMTASSYGVMVRVGGALGEGQAVVPFVARATRVTSLPRGLGGILVTLAILLGAGLVTIVFAAVRESVVPAHGTIDARRHRWAIASSAVAVAATLGIVRQGNAWWGAEARAYGRSIAANAPFGATATVHDSAGAAVLTLAITDPAWRQPASGVAAGRRWTPLIPDHGKLMHAFLVADDGDGFAHLHPVSLDSVTFRSVLPPLPAGRYRLFADIVHESGWSQTLAAPVTITAAAANWSPADGDDAWSARPPAPDTVAAEPAGGHRVVFRRDSLPLEAGRDLTLRFEVHDPAGRTADLDPYLGMAGHLVIVRDSTVYIHLHPSGTTSMAAAEQLAARLGGTAGTSHHAPARFPGTLAFPYRFPGAGRYRVWVQVKVGGAIRTFPFRVDVAAAGAQAAHP